MFPSLPLELLRADLGGQEKIIFSGACIMGFSPQRQGFIGAGRSSEDFRAATFAASLSSPEAGSQDSTSHMAFPPFTFSISPPQGSSMVLHTPFSLKFIQRVSLSICAWPLGNCQTTWGQRKWGSQNWLQRGSESCRMSFREAEGERMV